jgi:glycogen(starch) synthase
VAKPTVKPKATTAPVAATAATRLTKAALPAAGIGVAQLNLESITLTPTSHEKEGNGKSGNGKSPHPETNLLLPISEDRPPTPHGQAQFPDSIKTTAERATESHKVLDVETPITLSRPGGPAATAESRTASLLEELDYQDTPIIAPPIPTVRQFVEPALLFEIGWEVCWQLGGIYTVLRSKAAMMLRLWGDRYCLIGPYNPQTAPVEFEPAEPHGHMKRAVRRLQEMGIPCYFGHWMIAGRPNVLLLDYRAKFRDLDTDKYLMWTDHGISVPTNDGELNEVVAFGFSVTEFFRILCEELSDQPVLAHFHEWMAGVAVPRIAHLQLPISTVFTTHATLLGRYLAGDNADFYNHLPFLDPEVEAKKYQIYPRYQIEKAATHAAVVFTTVSEVTAYEAEKLLGRRADTILPNGLNIQRFAALHEFQNLHRQYKEKIHEFVMGHFFPAYTFDLENTIYLVTSGRYEYRNKGMDLFIEALARLNHRMRYLPDRPTVVAFIISKAPVRHVNISALQNQTMFEELKRTCKDLQEEMGQKLFLAAAQGKFSESCDLLGGDAMVRLKRAVHAWRTGQNPIIVTHDLVNDQADPTLKHLRHRGLFNNADDAVKVVFHPQFVTQIGPLIHLDYEQFVRGCHAGIFPSYYEPWGYTPMECVALGVPAVTTDLSGFGAYVRRHIPESGDKGICVLNRRYRSFDDSCNELVDYLFNFVRMSRRERIELRNKVERLSELFDWSALVRHYREAHDMALERVGAPKPGRVEVRMI